MTADLKISRGGSLLITESGASVVKVSHLIDLVKYVTLEPNGSTLPTFINPLE